MTDTRVGFFAPWAIYAGLLLLHLMLPARRVIGYVSDERSGELLRDRLNGLLVLMVRFCCGSRRARAAGCRGTGCGCIAGRAWREPAGWGSAAQAGGFSGGYADVWIVPLRTPEWGSFDRPGNRWRPRQRTG